jgi:excisionase family DNA binding protein
MEKICIVKRRQQYAQPEVKLPQPGKSDAITPAVVTGGIAIENPIKFPDKRPDGINIEVEEVISRIEVENRSAFKDNNIVEEFVRSFSMEKEIELSDKEITAKPVTSVNIQEKGELPDKKIVEEFVDNSASVISIMMTKEQSTLLQQSEYIKELLNGTKSDPSFDIKLTPEGQLAVNFRFNDSLILRMLAPNQVCQMLQVSRSFLQKLIHENKIKSYKLGRMRRFLLEDILEYLSNDAEFAQLNNER